MKALQHEACRRATWLRQLRRVIARIPALTALVLVTAACGPAEHEDHLPEVLIGETEHFLYYARPGEAVCPEVLEELESHFRTTQAALGFDWPEGRKISYYRYRDLEDLSENSRCVRCTSISSPPEIQVRTQYFVDRHELVHAYLVHLGMPHLVLIEGIAELFDCVSTDESDFFVVADWRDALFHGKDLGWYDPASVFVRRLLDRFGPEAYLAAFKAGKWSDTPAGLEAQVAAGWGLTMDEAWADTIEHRRWGRYLPYCGCEGVVLPPEGERRLNACERRAGRAMVYDAPRDGFVALETHTGLPYQNDGLRACDAQETSYALPVGSFPGRMLTFGPVSGGERYFTTGATSARATPLANVFGSACENAPTYTVTNDTWIDTISVNTSRQSGTFRVWLENSTDLPFFSASEGVRICMSCDEQSEAGECPAATDRFGRDELLPSRFLLEVPVSKVVQTLEAQDRCLKCPGQSSLGYSALISPECPARCFEGEPLLP